MLMNYNIFWGRVWLGEKIFDYFFRNVYIFLGGELYADTGKTMGNNQGTRLSKDILQAVNVEINDILEVKVSDGINVTDAIQSIFDYI